MKKSKSTPKAEVKVRAKKNAQITKPVDLAEVRKDITNLVGGEATQLAQAVLEEGKKGQLAPVKYLFEVAGLYPASTEAASVKPEEDSLAFTLLRRLGVPEQSSLPSDDLPPEKTLLVGKNSVPQEGGKRDSGGAESKTAKPVNEGSI